MKLFNTIDTSFENFDNTINKYLSKALNNIGIEYSNSHLFGIVFSGIKGVMQNIMFYIEDAFTEQNIFRAIRKKSVYSLAKISGYEAFYGSAASGILIGKSQINNGIPNKATKIYITNHSRVKNSTNGLNYSIVLPTFNYVFDVSKPLVSHEFKIVQGNFESFTYVAKGTVLEAAHLTTVQLFDRNYIEVKVNGKTWTEVSNLYDMSEEGEEYMISIGYDNSFDVIFGNGVYGKLLTEGDTVTITYLKHGGESGNVSTNDVSEFTFLDYGSDSLGENVNINDYMKLYVSTCISGGANSDSIDFIRNMVGTNSRSLVLASSDNFRLFFKRFSFIGYVNCWAESNSMTINAVCLSNVKSDVKSIDEYFNLDPKKMLLNNEQKEMIINTLENSKRSFAGISLNFKDPIIRKYAFICYVKADNVYNKDIIKTAIKKMLGNYFLNLKDDTQFISKSELVSLILDECDNIKSLEMNIISEAAETAYYENYYIKYEMKHNNGLYYYVPVKYSYEPDNLVGLDSYGNISLDCKMEIPILHGGFKYYPNKDNNNSNLKNDSIRLKEIEIYFI